MMTRSVHGGIDSERKAEWRVAYMGRRLGCVAVALGTVAWAAWLTGRLADASVHPLWVVVYATEVLGVVTGAVVAVVIARQPLPAASMPDQVTPGSRDRGISQPRRDGHDPDSYPTAIGDLLETRPEPDLRASVRGAWRPAFAAHVPIADRALALVHFEGMRRLVLIVGLVAEPAARCRTARATGAVDARRSGRRSRAHVGGIDAAGRRPHPTR